MSGRKTETQFALSVFFSVLAVLINYAITFVLTPYITENIGTEAYGFVTLAKTIANYASVLTIALNSFSARYISVEYHRNNKDKANSYFNSILIADIVLSVIILCVAIAFILNIDKCLDVPNDLVLDVQLLFLFDIFNFIIITCSSVFLCSTIIVNRLELGSIAKCISYIAEALFLFLAFYLLPPNVAYVGIGLIISSLIVLITNIIINNRMTPELRIMPTSFSGAAVKEVVGAGIWNSINSLGNLLNTGLDLVICNIMLSPLRAGQLSIIKTISTIFSTLFQLISQPFQPLQLKYYAEKNNEMLVQSFNLGIKLNGLVSNVAFGFLFVYGVAYYSLWTPSQDITLLQNISIITIIGSVIEGAVYPLYYIYTITIKNKVPCIITVISGLLNVTGMYLLIRVLNADIYAVVGTTTVLSWLVNFVFNPMYSARCLGLKVTTFYPTLARHIISCISMTAVFRLCSLLYFPSTWLSLILVGVMCLGLGTIIHSVLVFNKKEIGVIASRVLRKSR